MRNLFKHWDNLKGELSDKYVMLFLDYDGTLVPIVDEPDKAVVSKETKNLLAELLQLPDFRLTIISGRDLKDIKAKTGIKNIIYAGNHGFQIEGPGIKFKKSVSQRYKTILKKIKQYLVKNVSYIKGVFIEDKGFSLSLHYRMVAQKEVPLVKRFFYEIVGDYSVKGDIDIKTGKKLLEVKPAVDWNKGKAVLWLLARQRLIFKNAKILPIYIGDDVTDEDAFKALRKKGICICVGRANKRSYAEYYLQSPQEVKNFLIRLKEILK